MGRKSLQKLQNECRTFGTILPVQKQPEAVAIDEQVDLLMAQMGTSPPRSCIIVGPSGVGKTALIREAARRLGRGNNKRYVLQTSAGILLAGTKYLGEWQTRVQRLCDFVREHPAVLVYFTDVHLLMTTGTSEKSDENIGDYIAPLVERGEMTLLAECTETGFRLGVAAFPRFERLFQVIQAAESSVETTREILAFQVERRVGELQEANGTELVFDESAIDSLSEYAPNFIPGQCRPGNLVQLLERVVDLYRSPQHPAAGGRATVVAADVVAALEKFSGIPGALLDDARPLELAEVRSFFEARVLGQPDAVNAMVDLIAMIKAGLTDPKKPLGSFFFVGPTGVGKTELAKALATYIFGSHDRLVRLDMSEYKDHDSFEKLIGNAYNNRSEGTLTGAVRHQPFSVILFDEIEKAHPNLFDLMLQLLDDGRLTDGTGQTTNFTKTIVIMTSNIGATTSGVNIGFGGDGGDAARPAAPQVPAAMQDFFRPEFINRIDRIIQFRALGREDMQLLARREVGQVLLRSGITRRNVRVEVDQGVYEALMQHGFSPAFGARPLKRAVEQHLLLPIAKQIVNLGEEDAAPLLRVGYKKGKVQAKTFRDRVNQRARKLNRSVKIVDPVSEQQTRRTPAAVAAQIAALVASLEDASRQERMQQLDDEKSRFVELCSAVDFWDKPGEARAVLAELYRVERILDAASRARQRILDLAKYAASSDLQVDARHLAAVAERTQEVHCYADVVGFSLATTCRVQRCDAFLELTRLDGTSAPDDVLRLLLDVYRDWARSKGFSVKVVHEAAENDQLSRVELLLEGIALAGLLAGEDGIHELTYHHGGKQAKTSHQVRVRVLPIPDWHDEAWEMAQPRVTTRVRRGVGVLGKFRNSASGRVDGIEVVMDSQLDKAEVTELCYDRLRAERYRLSQEDTNETLVRKYNFGNRKAVKDQQVNIVCKSFDEFRNRGFDHLIHFRIGATEIDS